MKPAASYAARAGAWPVATGLDDRDVHAAAQHVLGGVLRESGADPASLVVGIDTDDVDHPHAFVERVQRNCGEPDRLSVGDGHEDVPLLAQQLDRDRLGLTSAPVRVQAEKDLVPEDFPNRVEDGLPRPEGERDYRVKVF